MTLTIEKLVRLNFVRILSSFVYKQHNFQRMCKPVGVYRGEISQRDCRAINDYYRVAWRVHDGYSFYRSSVYYRERQTCRKKNTNERKKMTLNRRT